MRCSRFEACISLDNLGDGYESGHYANDVRDLLFVRRLELLYPSTI